MEEFHQKPRAHFQPCVLHCTCLHFPSRMSNWKHSVSTPDHKRSRMLLDYHTFHKGEKAVCCSVSQIRLKRSNSVSSSHTQTIYTCTIQLCWSILINLRKSRIGFKISFSSYTDQRCRNVISYALQLVCFMEIIKNRFWNLTTLFVYLWIGFSHYTNWTRLFV